MNAQKTAIEYGTMQRAAHNGLEVRQFSSGPNFALVPTADEGRTGGTLVFQTLQDMEAYLYTGAWVLKPPRIQRDFKLA